MNLTFYIIPLFFTLIFILGIRKNNYSSFIKGCKKGIEVALDSFPYILAMMMATRLLSGSLLLVYALKDIKIPSLFLMQAIFRPLSSSASTTLLLEIFTNYGVDSKLGIAASILQGATDSSLFMCAFYFGYIGVKKYQYTLFMGLICNVLTFVITLILLFCFL